MSVIFRKLQAEDAAALEQLDRESFSIPWMKEEFERLLSRDYCTYYVAEENGQILGCAGFVNLCGEADIDKVVVAGAVRGRGIATGLMRVLLEDGEKNGVEAFTLEVRVSNRAAIHLYEKFGFVTEGIRPRFYEKPIEDANIMWRR